MGKAFSSVFKISNIICLLGLFLYSCSNTSPKPPDVDIVKIAPQAVKAYPQIFETAFFEGTTANQDSIHFYTADIGKLDIESGYIIACDPVVMYNAEPFTQKFPVGRFRVQLAIVKIMNDERVAFSRILFSNEPVVKWEYALQEGEKPIPLESDSFYGYGVDAGIGLFIDQKANEEFNRLNGSDNKYWEKIFVDGMSSNHLWDYILYHFGTHSLASFSTGYGDGAYATFIGYDSHNQACRLLTDFELVDWRVKK